jgi:DNA-binding NtrC family response regulator
VRELENAIRSSLLAAESVIDVEHLPEYLRRSDEAESDRRAPARLPLPLLRQVKSAFEMGNLDLKAVVAQNSEEFEKAILSEILEERHFNQRDLCGRLKLDPKTLRAKLQKYGLKIRPHGFAPSRNSKGTI